MAFSFPASPTVGQQYSANGKLWEWDGVAWRGLANATNVVRSNQDNFINNGNLTISKNSADTVLDLITDTGGTYDTILNIRSGQVDGISNEGHQIWYDNSTGDTHFNNTWSAGAIRFHTATATNKVATGTNERVTILSNGNVGIGTTNPTFNLDVNGTFRATSITESSSIVLKENVRPIEDSLSFIKKLNGVVYDRKDGSSKDEAGLIAEEVYKVLPNLVSLVDGAPEAIQYTKLTAYLIEAVKSLITEIDELKNK
jgi:hypothetical protein